MSYKDEWLMIEANDDIDEDFHREPTEEFLFYRAVANGDVETVRRNCEQARFEDQEGVGVLSRNPVTNMKYHFVVTTAMIPGCAGNTAWSWSRLSGSAIFISGSWTISIPSRRSAACTTRW